MYQDIAQQIKDTAKEQIADIHTAIPARVTAFDPAACTASVKPYGLFEMADGTTLEFPEISQVPVVMPFSTTSGVGMAVPVRPGDDALLVFSETELEAWRNNSLPQGTMRFDLSNAVAIPGILKTNSLVSLASSLGAAVLGSPSAYIAVSPSGITINGQVTVNGSIAVDGNISADNLDD